MSEMYNKFCATYGLKASRIESLKRFLNLFR